MNMVKKRKAKRKTKTKRKSSGKKSGLMPMTWNLSADLAAVVGAKKMTRPQVVKKVWAYIKAKKLQDAKKKRIIHPDAKLGAVLGRRPIDMLKMTGVISKHIKRA